MACWLCPDHEYRWSVCLWKGCVTCLPSDPEFQRGSSRGALAPEGLSRDCRPDQEARAGRRSSTTCACVSLGCRAGSAQTTAI